MIQAQAAKQIVAILLIVTTAVAMADSPTAPPASAPSESNFIKIYQLRFAEPSEIAKTLTAAGIGGARFVPQDGKHALVVSAGVSRFKEIESLIEQLDVPTSDPKIQVIQLRHARIDTIVDSLRAAYPKLKIGIDRPTNSLLIDAAWMHTVTELLDKLDQPMAVFAPPNYSLRLVWLVSDEKLPPPPPDLKDALDELSAMGVQGLRLAAQVMSVAKGKFNVESTPAAFVDCNLKLEGMLMVGVPGETPWLDLTLSTTGVMTEAERNISGYPGRPFGWRPELASFKTSAGMPLGHKVVLGVAPIGKYTSVFVIQLVEAPGTRLPTPPVVAPAPEAPPAPAPPPPAPSGERRRR